MAFGFSYRYGALTIRENPSFFNLYGDLFEIRWNRWEYKTGYRKNREGQLSRPSLVNVNAMNLYLSRIMATGVRS